MWREVESIDQTKTKCGEREDGDDADEGERANAARAHGRDFGVGGKAAEAEQDAGKDRSGNGDGERIRQHVREDAGRIGQRRGVAHQKIEDIRQVAHEQHEGEQNSAEDGVGDHFAENVPGEDAHSASLSVIAPLEFEAIAQLGIDLAGVVVMEAAEGERVVEQRAGVADVQRVHRDGVALGEGLAEGEVGGGVGGQVGTGIR